MLQLVILEINISTKGKTKLVWQGPEGEQKLAATLVIHPDLCASSIDYHYGIVKELEKLSIVLPVIALEALVNKNFGKGKSHGV